MTVDAAPSPAIAPYWDRPLAYSVRARQVYWNKTTPACRAGGAHQAECLLAPDHEGPHYGNGFDQWGPRCPMVWS